jgi:carbon monoxide dehydrogenase subunit G
MEEVGPGKYEVTMKVGVAGITGTYQGTLEIRDERPPEGYILAVAGEGTPGYVRGTGTFQFTGSPGGQTMVAYTWDLQVGGTVAGVGQRVLGGVAKLLIGQFMKAMQSRLDN